MGQHRKESRKGLGAITQALPTRRRSKAGPVAALADVALSAAVHFKTDHPQLSLAIQAPTAFGVAESSDQE